MFPGLSGLSSSFQKGQAAEGRYYSTIKETRESMSKIVHSSDPNPHKYGHNEFADPNNKWDPKAQKVIDQELARQGKGQGKKGKK
mmetsp:Transcript_37646/g.60712  ORF Transcript_37646/g.60712 Transcript_37646/m.60712 type:complete len:85 (+) Transcript_37646:102-356(+)